MDSVLETARQMFLYLQWVIVDILSEMAETLTTIFVFHRGFSLKIFILVALQVFIKHMHWLAQARLGYIQATRSNSHAHHFHIVSFLGLLLYVDFMFLGHSSNFLDDAKKESFSYIFTFEFILLSATVISIFAKYVLYVIDMKMDGQWEKKHLCSIFMGIYSNLVYILIYSCFLYVSFMNNCLPVHVLRRSFKPYFDYRALVGAFNGYRRMKSTRRLPDATAGELNGSDATCVICREEMTSAKKLGCGHLFHAQCLSSWLLRRNECPTCRASLLRPRTARGARAGNNLSQTSSSVGAARDGPTQHRETAASPAGESDTGDLSNQEECGDG